VALLHHPFPAFFCCRPWKTSLPPDLNISQCVRHRCRDCPNTWRRRNKDLKMFHLLSSELLYCYQIFSRSIMPLSTLYPEDGGRSFFLRCGSHPWDNMVPYDFKNNNINFFTAVKTSNLIREMFKSVCKIWSPQDSTHSF
jgi:hypothetical protein